MLCLSDFVSCSKSLYILEWGVYISAVEHCRKMKFIIQLHLTLINKARKKNVLVLVIGRVNFDANKKNCGLQNMTRHCFLLSIVDDQQSS